MWYRGTKQRCEDYNAIVSYSEAYEGIANKNALQDTSNTKEIKGTDSWGTISEIAGTFYILKHPSYNGAYLTEVEVLPVQKPIG